MKIFIAGDSTAATPTPDKRPKAGWGEFLSAHFLPEVEIRNFAMDDCSSKSFINRGLLSAINYEIQPGDFLLIQFGHNDQLPDEEKETTPFGSYKYYLRKYIDAARKNAATPLLLTPVVRGQFAESGEVLDTLGNYPDACWALGVESEVTVLDLSQATKDLYHGLGQAATEKLFLNLPAGVHPNYLDGSSDHTHSNYDGAKAVAKLVATAIAQSNSPLKTFLQK